MATSLFLVTVFGRETSFFGDEASSRHHFEAGNAQFLTTKRLLVANLGRETLIFGDDPLSRHRFWSGNFIFWRRGQFSLLILTELSTIKFLGIRWLNVF
ncbi:hypothetical protein [Caldifermentibacillus hisashii]|uniref:hypothetical protein n=1 Tax=Caldifermentibacillus hisashii TaxID=996558 RepID=UPI0030E79E44